MDWGQAEENVRRLRQRIFAASRAGDLKKVRSLQKLMLRSRDNALESWTDRVASPAGGRLSAEGLTALDTLARSMEGR